MSRADVQAAGPLAIGLGAGLVAAFALAVASAWLMSLAADEAWLLLGIQSLAERGQYAHAHGLGALTTGGLYTLAELGLFLVAGNDLFVLRLFPLLCFALLLLELVRWARRAGFGWTAALLVPAPLIAMPGTLTLAGAAFGGLPALLLIVLALRLWDPEPPGTRRPLVAGALLGLAVATRVQVVFVLPALLLGVWAAARSAREQLRALAPPLLVGVLVFAAGYAGLAFLTGAPAGALELAALSGGVGDPTPVSFQAKRWVVGDGFFGLPLVVGSVVVAAWLGHGLAGGQRLRVLVAFGCLSWLAFVFATPRLHLRYLWPGLGAFGVVLGFGLAAWHQRSGSAGRGARAAAVAVGVACLLTAGLGAARNLYVGELNVVFWEWRESLPVQPNPRRRPFQPGRHQARMAEYLGGLPKALHIAVFDHAVELDFLSGRTLRSVDHYYHHPEQPKPRFLVMTPHVGGRSHIRAGGWRWLDRNAELVARTGDYALYQVVGRYPPSLEDLRARLGPWAPNRNLKKRAATTRTPQ